MRRRLIKEIDPETGVVVCEMHRLNNQLHRDPAEGPAYIARTRDGEIAEERYYWLGRLHRPDGPAKLAYDVEDRACCEIYYRHGLLHRDPKQGPAWIEREGEVAITESYYFNGVPYRNPADGPRHIARFDSGEIEHEVYCDAGEVLPNRRQPRNRPRPQASKVPAP